MEVNIHSQIRIWETENHVARMRFGFGLLVFYYLNTIEVLVDGPQLFQPNFEKICSAISLPISSVGAVSAIRIIKVDGFVAG